MGVRAEFKIEDHAAVHLLVSFGEHAWVDETVYHTPRPHQRSLPPVPEILVQHPPCTAVSPRSPFFAVSGFVEGGGAPTATTEMLVGTACQVVAVAFAGFLHVDGGPEAVGQQEAGMASKLGGWGAHSDEQLLAAEHHGVVGVPVHGEAVVGDAARNARPPGVAPATHVGVPPLVGDFAQGGSCSSSYSRPSASPPSASARAAATTANTTTPTAPTAPSNTPIASIACNATTTDTPAATAAMPGRMVACWATPIRNLGRATEVMVVVVVVVAVVAAFPGAFALVAERGRGGIEPGNVVDGVLVGIVWDVVSEAVEIVHSSERTSVGEARWLVAATAATAVAAVGGCGGGGGVRGGVPGGL